MAKGKHSAALFEVIKQSKPERVAQSMRTPKWWFKGRQTPVNPAPSPAEPNFSGTEYAATDSTAVTSPVPARSTSRFERSESPRSSAIHLDFNTSRKEVTFRLRYTTALVSAFGICALIGIAYVVGRHMSNGPQRTQADVVGSNNIQQLMKQPPQANVADLNRVRSVDRLQQNGGNTSPRPAPPSAGGVNRPAETFSLVPAGGETGMPRAIGLNYVIIATYPPEESAAADAARDYLNKSGIPCTIEKTDYVRNANWVCLVGTAGFTKISGTDFKTYVDNIIKLGEKFPTSHFNQFKPAAYKWKG